MLLSPPAVNRHRDMLFPAASSMLRCKAHFVVIEESSEHVSQRYLR